TTERSRALQEAEQRLAAGVLRMLMAVELQSIGSGRRVRAVLAVGTGSPPGTAERYAVNSAVALLTLTTERSRALQEAEQRLAAGVLRMLMA
ncbi:hypothetical protein ACSNOF_27590, partial [Streptomyces sp. URMC 125]